MVKIVCVDDESIILRQTIEQCRQRIIAFIDINLPDMNGIALAVCIKEKSPDTAIIFITGYSDYAVDAFKIHAAGYLMKPVTQETLASEIEHALSLYGHSAPVTHTAHIAARTFGSFEIFVDNKPHGRGRRNCSRFL